MIFTNFFVNCTLGLGWIAAWTNCLMNKWQKCKYQQIYNVAALSLNAPLLIFHYQCQRTQVDIHLAYSWVRRSVLFHPINSKQFKVHNYKYIHCLQIAQSLVHRWRLNLPNSFQQFALFVVARLSHLFCQYYVEYTFAQCATHCWHVFVLSSVYAEL